MTTGVLRMRDLSWPVFGELIGRRPLILPLGAIEQHGPHLPLDTDTTTAIRFSEGVGARTGGIVLPSFQYGYKSQPMSGGGRTFPGTTSLSGEAFTACVRDLIADLVRQGARAIVLMNANYENTMFAVEGADLAVERLDPGTATVLIVNWWDQVAADVLDTAFDGAFPGWEAEHAGVIETSLMLHLDPTRVHVELLEPSVGTAALPSYWVIPERPELVPRSGVLRSAVGASAAIGRLIFDHAVDRIAAIVEGEFDLLQAQDV